MRGKCIFALFIFKLDVVNFVYIQQNKKRTIAKESSRPNISKHSLAPTFTKQFGHSVVKHGSGDGGKKI